MLILAIKILLNSLDENQKKRREKCLDDEISFAMI